MNIWLYDEFNRPYGDAGGYATAFEEFRLKAITRQLSEISDA